MLYVLYILFFVSCIVLIGAVLLQPGKTDAGALFTSNVASAAFGPRGTASVLSKITIVSAIVFMLSALMISMPAFTGGVSVLDAAETSTEETQQPAEVPAAANTNADANSSANVNTASEGALIETPATDAAQQEANSAPANR